MGASIHSTFCMCSKTKVKIFLILIKTFLMMMLPLVIIKSLLLLTAWLALASIFLGFLILYSLNQARVLFVSYSLSVVASVKQKIKTLFKFGT